MGMAIYHCSIKIITRSCGRSAVASAAYRSGEKLLNDETGIVHDFMSKGGVIMSEILLPEHAPTIYQNRETLWNEVQKTEKRCDAQLAREVEVAFPVEMTRSQQIECARAYIRENFVSKGMIADWAFHDKGDGNPHAHIMLTVRGFDENEHWQQKTKSVFANARDENGRAVFDPALPFYDPGDRENTSRYRIPVLDENGNQKTRIREGKGTEYLWEKINIPANDWNNRANAERWRASWAQHCNRYLEQDKRIDHRSYERQGLDQEPTIHEGVTARRMEQNGKEADRCVINREIRQRNSIREQIRNLAADITKIITTKARELYERFTRLTGNTGDAAKAGNTDRDDGRAAGRKRETGAAAGRTARHESHSAGTVGGMQAAIGSDKGGIGRNQELEREIEQRKPAIDAADRKLEQLADIISERRRKQDERIRRLMERRRSAHADGRDAGPDRTAAAGKGEPAGESNRKDGSLFTAGTQQLIRDIETAISAATGAEEAARAERSDREAERSRSDFARQREAERRERQKPLKPKHSARRRH